MTKKTLVASAFVALVTVIVSDAHAQRTGPPPPVSVPSIGKYNPAQPASVPSIGKYNPAQPRSVPSIGSNNSSNFAQPLSVP
jgi:hypothetical protein